MDINRAAGQLSQHQQDVLDRVAYAGAHIVNLRRTPPPSRRAQASATVLTSENRGRHRYFPTHLWQPAGEVIDKLG